ncbi:MAG: hypothetical protein M1817_000510 [Caeruleum heppii]|nr:MAG: hypothetical protein M1817_000510 [Caeruleum heppii]
MSLKIATRANQARTLPPLLLATYVTDKLPSAAIALKLEESDAIQPNCVAELDLNSGSTTVDDLEIVREFAKSYPKLLRGAHPDLEDEHLVRASRLVSPDLKAVETHLAELNAHLTLRSHIVGYALTIADIVVWGVLRGNRSAYGYIKKGHLVNVNRWFTYIDETNPWLSKTYDMLNVQQKERKAAKSKEGASYDIALPDTDQGVVTRFPPEPSGYLHIGHAKAALLNDYFAHEKYKGTLLLRFDDTNPSKEKEEFQDAIIEDMALMGIHPDRTSYTSEYFDQLYEFCIRMIREGNAYADDTDQATMRQQRMDGLASRRRDRSVAENLAILNEMKQGTELGLQNCIRAKMSVDNPNKAMRDPVIYRYNPLPHHRTGTKWKIYPTYDFCCPIVDSLEGVTHALRTIEYRDRNPQYNWMLDALQLRRVHIWDFARMNFIRTLLSKRKLAQFVTDGVVWGWDDPRFPTIRGIRRRGMTIGALREFILKQGPSRNIVNLDWTIFWATNKKYIDPVAPRHTAVTTENAVSATITNGPEEPYTEQKPRHGKNPDLGSKTVAYSRNILIDQEDARSFTLDEEITLMNWGNAFIRSITHAVPSDINSPITSLTLTLHLAGDVKKTSKKITWLSTLAQELIPVQLVSFDFLLTKDKLEEDDKVEDFLNERTEWRVDAVADGNVKDLEVDGVIQVERKGYFRVDRRYEPVEGGGEEEVEGVGRGKPAVLFAIPTGKEKGM